MRRTTHDWKVNEPSISISSLLTTSSSYPDLRPDVSIINASTALAWCVYSRQTSLWLTFPIDNVSVNISSYHEPRAYDILEWCSHLYSQAGLSFIFTRAALHIDMRCGGNNFWKPLYESYSYVSPYWLRDPSDIYVVICCVFSIPQGTYPILEISPILR